MKIFITADRLAATRSISFIFVEFVYAAQEEHFAIKDEEVLETNSVHLHICSIADNLVESL